jgi:ABC-type lipoprotein export system ATPase subunit
MSPLCQVENNQRFDVFIVTGKFVSINGMSRTGLRIMLNICHIKIQKTAGEVIISRASIRCLSSRFPDWRSQRHVRVVSQAVCRLIVTAIM